MVFKYLKCGFWYGLVQIWFLLIASLPCQSATVTFNPDAHLYFADIFYGDPYTMVPVSGVATGGGSITVSSLIPNATSLFVTMVLTIQTTGQGNFPSLAQWEFPLPGAGAGETYTLETKTKVGNASVYLPDPEAIVPATVTLLMSYSIVEKGVYGSLEFGSVNFAGKTVFVQAAPEPQTAILLGSALLLGAILRSIILAAQAKQNPGRLEFRCSTRINSMLRTVMGRAR